jgi:hypothetical protein
MRYNIPVIQEIFGIVEIEAESLEQALDIAERDQPSLMEFNVIEDSYEIDYGGIPAHNSDSVVAEWEKL